MILQALYNFYEARLRYEAGREVERPIAPPGLEYKPISWVLVINEEGRVLQIEDLRDPKDNKGQEYLVGEGIKRSGKNPPPQPFWDNRKYILGYEEKGGSIQLHKDRLEAFRELMGKISEMYPDNAGFRAVSLFYESYQPPLHIDGGTAEIAKEDWITFKLVGETELVATDEDAYNYAAREYSTVKDVGLCLVTGEYLPLANTHSHIQIPGSQAGATIVSFNDDAYLSYGKKQGENAPISKKASFAHTTAINYLLNEEQTHYRIGGVSYVFWNTGYDDRLNAAFLQEAFGATPDGQSNSNPVRDVRKIRGTFELIRGIRRRAAEHWGEEQEFYILGLAGDGRIAVKYWRRATIVEAFDHIRQHLEDLNMISEEGFVDHDQPPRRSLYAIIEEVSPPSKSDSFSISLTEGVAKSIFEGIPYPLTLQQSCIDRIVRERKVSELQAAILKGCINRKARNGHKLTELHMALDKENDNVAYVAGRLFAVLEEIQEASSGKTTNATIRDRFYGSASTHPNMVMGRLIDLSNHHLSKLRKTCPTEADKYDSLLQEIFALLPAQDPVFPLALSLDEQSLFAVGYYHQKADLSGERIITK